MRKLSNRFVRRLCIVLTVLGLCLAASIWVSQTTITVTEYSYESPKVDTPLRVVQLSDLHDNPWMGDGNQLVQRVQALQPDLIVMTGDMINNYSADDKRFLALIRALKDTAPLFFSPGNHEVFYMRERERRGLFADIEEAGAVVLNSEYRDLTIRGQRLRIGGLYDYTYNNRQLPTEDYRASDSYRFLAEFEDTDAFKLLLIHKPEFLLTEDSDADWDIDLALCGHEHGGQVRLPLLGGFFSTHMGWFSPYLDGAHLMNGIPAVISRGLGTYTWSWTGLPVPPRFCNTPELVEVEIR